MQNNNVFGIGWNRTGTRTLYNCLNILDVKCAHWDGSKHLCLSWVNQNWDEFQQFIVKSECQGFADAPWCFPDLYIHLFNLLPDSKFILTIRDSESWVNSYKNLYEKQFKDNKNLKVLPIISNSEEYGWIHLMLFQGSTLITGNEEKYKAIYEQHNNNVIEFFSDKPGKLLVIDWQQNPEWDEICEFLNKDIPKDKIPWVKDSRKLYER